MSTGLEDILDNTFSAVENLRFYDGTVILYYDSALHVYYTVDEDGVKQLAPGVTSVCGTLDKSGPLTQWSANMTVELLRQELQPYTNEEGIIQIPSPAFEELANKARFNYRQISKTATDIGHIAHDWLEQFIKMMVSKGVSMRDILIFPALPEHEKATNCVNAALDWMTLHKFRPVHSERKIYSREWGFAGTLDLTGYVTSCGDPKCCPFEGTIYELDDFKSSRNIYDEYRLQTAAYQYAMTEEFPDEKIQGRRILRLGKDDGEFESMFVPNESFEADIDAFLGLLQAFHWNQQIRFDKRFEKQEAKAIKAAASPPKKRRSVKRSVIKEYEPIPIEEKVA
jgi:hypothetical protein